MRTSTAIRSVPMLETIGSDSMRTNGPFCRRSPSSLPAESDFLFLTSLYTALRPAVAYENTFFFPFFLLSLPPTPPPVGPREPEASRTGFLVGTLIRPEVKLRLKSSLHRRRLDRSRFLSTSDVFGDVDEDDVEVLELLVTDCS